MKKILCIALIFIFAVSNPAIPAEGEAVDGSDIEQVYNAINTVISWRNSESGTASDTTISDDMITDAGSSVTDWFAFSFGRLGKEERLEEYISAVEGYVNDTQTQVVTDFQRLSLTILACGGDPTQLGLIDKAVFTSLNNDNIGEKTVNCLIYGLMTLDSMRYEIKADSDISRSALIMQILCSRLDSGAFSLSGDVPDTDITAMVIQALSPYYNSSEEFTYTRNGAQYNVTAREVVDSAIEYLSSIQLDDGDMPTWGSATCESTAQTIIALCCMGINPNTDERFVKSGRSLIDGLLKYQTDDGGFAHTLTEGQGSSNSLASVQSLYALCAYCRFVNGYRSLFDMREEMPSDIKGSVNELIDSIAVLDSGDCEVDTLNDLLADYTEIPVEERCYVYNFYILADALSENNIENTGDYTSDEIGGTASGIGTVVDVMKQSEAELLSDQYIETLDSAAVPLQMQNDSQEAADSNDYSSIAVAVLIAIGLAAVAAIIINHRFKKRI